MSTKCLLGLSEDKAFIKTMTKKDLRSLLKDNQITLTDLFDDINELQSNGNEEIEKLLSNLLRSKGVTTGRLVDLLSNNLFVSLHTHEEVEEFIKSINKIHPQLISEKEQKVLYLYEGRQTRIRKISRLSNIFSVNSDLS